MRCAGSGCRSGDVDWDEWGHPPPTRPCAVPEVTVAIVGKYVDLPDAYLLSDRRRCRGEDSPTMARGGPALGALRRGAVPQGAAARLLGRAPTVWLVPGGFGIRGIEGKIAALQYARLEQRPCFWACASACSAWSSRPPAISPGWLRQLHRVRPGDAAPGGGDDGRPDGRSRRRARHGRHDAPGLYPARLLPGSVAASAYGELDVSERHRHRYEVANAYRDGLSEAGFVFSGTSPDGRLVEVGELPRDTHPFYLGTQAHPEFPVAAHTGPPAVRRLHRGGGQARRVAAAGDGSGLTRGGRTRSAARRCARGARGPGLGASRGTRGPRPRPGTAQRRVRGPRSSTGTGWSYSLSAIAAQRRFGCHSRHR